MMRQIRKSFWKNGGESLLGKGDILCDAGKGIVRTQSYFILQVDF
jgi:hypothetical protein